MKHEELTQRIIGCAMNVHRTLGLAFLESVYQNAFSHELRKAGMRHDCERRIQVVYDGVIVGDFIADMFVEELVIVENKAIQVLATTHEVQLVTYLSATGPSVGTEGPGGSRVLLSRHYLRSTTSAPLRVTSTA